MGEQNGEFFELMGHIHGKVDKYFKENCLLDLYFYCSSASDEVSNDIGLGRGSLYTNHFMAKGTIGGNDMQRGKMFYVSRFDEDSEKENTYTQTT